MLIHWLLAIWDLSWLHHLLRISWLLTIWDLTWLHWWITRLTWLHWWIARLSVCLLPILWVSLWSCTSHHITLTWRWWAILNYFLDNDFFNNFFFNTFFRNRITTTIINILASSSNRTPNNTSTNTAENKNSSYDSACSATTMIDSIWWILVVTVLTIVEVISIPIIVDHEINWGVISNRGVVIWW